MPPKRKAASTLPGQSPTKRSTRSTVPDVDAQPTETRVLRSSHSTIPVTTPRRNIKTYGGRASARRLDQSIDSLKENVEQEEPDGSEEKSSDDELDMLSPTKLAAKRTSKPSPTDVSLDIPARSPMTRSRSGRLSDNIDTPTRKQSKRRLPQPSLETAPLPLPSKGKGKATLPALAEPTQTLSARVTRYYTSSRTKPLQEPSSKPTPSPKKKLAANKNDNTNQGAKRRSDESRDPPDSDDTTALRNVQSPRKQPKRAVQEGIDEPSQKQKSTAHLDLEAHHTPSRAAGRLSSTDTDRISPPPAPLKFDSVMIPSLAKPRQLTPSTKTASRAGTASLPPAPISPSDVPPPVTPHASPFKKKATTLSSPTRLPRVLPRHLHTCLNAQKKAILHALQRPPELIDDEHSDEGTEDDEPSTNSVAAQQLTSLLNGTVSRGEGNSCLILGPRGSGKSRLVEQCMSNVSRDNPVILRLSGWTQHSDRLAMREIAYQLSQQTGTAFLTQTDDGSPDDEAADRDEKEVNPFLDAPTSSKISLPRSSHLPALISVLPTLNRPTIVILDGFDLFALHPRQSLLYCLLDTAQSCRATAGTKGLAVIGITSRIDTINGLEKRVKSRFSGRMLRTAPPRTIEAWEKIARAVLSSDINEFMRDQPEEEDTVAEWQGVWNMTVDQFLSDQAVQTALNETFSVTRDVRMLSRILLSVVLRLSPASPSLSSSQCALAATAQRARPRFPLLHTLHYPGICLLIASIHADTAGQATFTFEMLHEYFRDQVRASTSAPVQVKGGSIGMVRCSRQILMTAFEDLVSAKVFIPAAAYAASIAKEFVKYRSNVDREAVKKAVDIMNQVNLKKWLTKAQ